jgi:hypothetical protein
MAGHIPIRDLRTLEAQLGVADEELRRRLVRNASIASAAVGAAAGAAVAASELAVPAWWTIPFELAVETVVIAGIEMKMLAELQATTGRPLDGTPGQQAIALARAWAEGRGVRPAEVVVGGGLGDILGRAARDQLAKAMRRRLARRLSRNLATLLPVLTGAAAAAEVNRRATLALGDKVRKELAAGAPA